MKRNYENNFRERLRLSGEEILSQLKQFGRTLSRITQDAIVKGFKISDPELDEIVRGTEEGEQAENLARGLLSRLAMEHDQEKSKFYPLLDYQTSDQVEVAHATRASLLRFKTQKIPRAYKQIKDKWTADLFSPKGPEWRQQGDYWASFHETFRLHNSTSLIREDVVDSILNKKHNTESFLQFVEPVTKKTLSFNNLLPAEVKVLPSFMAEKRINQFIVDVEDARHDTNNPTLAQYVGANRDQTGNFSFVTEFLPLLNGKRLVTNREVRYGNLSEPGARLRLLHEIAHAWRSTHDETVHRYRFEDWVLRVQKIAKFYIHDNISDSDSTVFEQLLEDNDATPRSPKNNSGEEGKTDFSIKTNLPLQVNEAQTAEGVNLREDITTKAELPITSHTLKTLLDNYIAEERNAWSDAIRILRLLRRKGIDLEPTLKKLADFEKVINPALDSYDEAVTESVTPPKQQRRFRREKPSRKSTRENAPK